MANPFHGFKGCVLALDCVSDAIPSISINSDFFPHCQMYFLKPALLLIQQRTLKKFS